MIIDINYFSGSIYVLLLTILIYYFSGNIIQYFRDKKYYSGIFIFTVVVSLLLWHLKDILEFVVVQNGGSLKYSFDLAFLQFIFQRREAISFITHWYLWMCTAILLFQQIYYHKSGISYSSKSSMGLTVYVVVLILDLFGLWHSILNIQWI